MSSDPPGPRIPRAQPIQDENTGIDLARSALAEARASARERMGKAGPTRSRRTQRAARPGDARDPATFGDALAGLISERGWEVPVAVGDAMDRWAEIVGADIAAHAEPLTFDEGVLAVQASSTAWATQLRLLAPDIVRRLNVELGHGTVIRIDVKAPSGPSWRKGRLRVQDGRGPRDTYG